MELHPLHQHALDAVAKRSSVRLENGKVVSTKAEVDAHFQYAPAKSAQKAKAETQDEDNGLMANTVKDLKAMAEELGVEGANKMNKATLVEAIEAAQKAKAETQDEEEEPGE